MSTQKRLFLLDAYALIFRGYYAFIKNPRINSKGMDTSAIMGFMNSLMDVIKREKPDHLAVAFDKGGSDYRYEMYQEYKAHRDETPEAIKIAVPYIQELLKAMHIPIIEKAGDLAAILTNLNEGDVLFIDEIHRLSRSVEEILYPSMEDFAIDIITGKGQMAASYHLPLPKFTLVGATTRAGQLTAPLRDRFGVVLRLELYTPEELAQIVERSAGILGIKIEHDGALEIASRSRGTPRIANRLLKRVRDFAQVMSNGVITLETARTALDRLEIDELGLDRNDRRMLEAIVRFYNGGPVGLETLAAAIGEEAVTIEDVYEPYLLQIGFVSRTPRGRCITAEACKHLGCEFPKGVVNAQPTQPTLFGDRES